MTELLPVFPLSTVLFPGGTLSLRIFEPRYLTMVSDCMRSGSEFAVALITDGKEVGQPAAFHQLATLASIIDFDQLDDGMLGLTCKGSQMVRIGEYHTQPDNLIRAKVERLPAEVAIPVDDEHETVRAFLMKVLDQADMSEYRQGLDEDWDNVVWIGYRLAELLPISVENRQALLAASPYERMRQLDAMLQQSKLI